MPDLITDDARRRASTRIRENTADDLRWRPPPSGYMFCTNAPEIPANKVVSAIVVSVTYR